MKIKLRNSQFVALIDERDAELAQYTWSLHSSLGVIRYEARDYNAKTQRTPQVIMSRVITCAPPKSYVIHLDNDPLNNKRSNLLLLSALQYAQYVPRERGKSGIIGASFQKGAYQVIIGSRYIGRYADPVEAANVYDQEAIKRYGESARLNSPRCFLVCHECHRGFFELATTTCAECKS